MYVSIIYDAGTRPYPPRMRRNLKVILGNQWGWNFHTVRGGIDTGDRRFRLGLTVELKMNGRISDRG